MYHLRLCHQVRLGKKASPEEIYELIAKEWEERVKANDRAKLLLGNAEVLIKEGADNPAPRNELRKFVLNSAFWRARLAIREAQDLLAPLFERQIHAGESRWRQRQG